MSTPEETAVKQSPDAVWVEGDGTVRFETANVREFAVKYIRADIATQAVAGTPKQAEPLFLLHTGHIDSDGEQDEFDCECNSFNAVKEFCRQHPGQTIGLFPDAQAEASTPVAWANQANLISASIARERGGQFDQHTWSEAKTDYHEVPLYASPPDHTALLRQCLSAVRGAESEMNDVLRSINYNRIHFDGDEFHERMKALKEADAALSAGLGEG